MGNLAQSQKTSEIARDLGAILVRGLRESAFLLYAAVALFFLVSLLTFDLEDPGWSHSGTGTATANGGGAVGAWIADVCLSLFGITAFLFPFLLAGYGYSMFLRRSFKEDAGHLNFALRWSGFGAAIITGAALADLHLPRPPLSLPQTSGGILGQEAADLLAGAFGGTGATILLSAVFLGGISLYTGLSWLSLLDSLGRLGLVAVDGCGAVFQTAFQWFDRFHGPEPEPEPAIAVPEEPPARIEPVIRRKAQPAEAATADRPPPVISAPPSPPPATPRVPAARAPEPAKAPPPAAKPVEAPKIAKAAKPPAKTESLPPLPPGTLPELGLLSDKAPRIKGYSQEALEDMSRLVETILADFGVQVQVMEVHPGPVITRFEIQPAPGVKVSRISGLAKDMARALSVTSVRVVEIIPGKTVIGLEIPNEERELVLLYSVICSSIYEHAASPLTMVLGKDISGQPVVANLARMPHVLVAGTTGSGKSVAVNVMILSMLFKARPDEVRLIMIDPKMLELSIYEGIPHLLTPVVTDMKEAANALRWSVAEMERRYKLMSLVGVRNLAGFNQKVAEAIDAGEPLADPMWSADKVLDGEEPPLLEPLPFIVVVIDELADMMMIVGKKVEELIARLAQKARAAGIHLILATQRPSVDVITGLIKANIPTRIAFQVSSRIDSRTIIDQGGAESLLGNGDMLYLPPGTGLPMRAHGAFVSDQEVHNVVEFLKRTGPANYIEAITKFSEDGGDFSGVKGGAGSGGGEGGEETDSLYDEAVRFVVDSRKASISSVQRRFKVGYNRAARLIEDMEKAGIVGAAETNGNRVVLAPPTAEL